MTVILLITCFVALIAIDYFKNRNQVPVKPEIPVRVAAVPRVQPSVVAGFHVQDSLKYHPGHTWAISEGPSLVRVGMDDFGSKLVGEVEAVTLPQRGQWIRQGQKIVSLRRKGETIEIASPIEGSVADVNDELARDPKLLNKDCYGEGWFLTVDSPDAKTNFRNLLGGQLVRSWTDNCAQRLSAYLPKAGVPTMADGGIATNDLASMIPAEKYNEAVREFFL